MDEIQIKQQLGELIEQVEGFFTRKTEEQGRASFKEHREGVLVRIPEMDGTLRDYPMYGAIGFLGKLQFMDCPEVKMLATASSAEILEAIREKQAVLVTKSALPAWKHLLEKDPETLCAIVALCYLASKKKAITKRL